ncbi:hypothetical protein V501_07189 [Pseudogymnoascus sp. VKM F-4519 (FW-2642)]|nr:hypothetical protein V501_07189 [Pseudogymnoascus sp. VKM F-4519 (FW-2642)]
MKLPVITLTCLASFVATAYAHPDTNVIEKRDDDTFKSALKLASSELGVVTRVVPAQNARTNARESVRQIEESNALTEAGYADVKLLFQDLGAASKVLLNEFIAKKPTIKAKGQCNVSLDCTHLLQLGADDLVNAVAYNSESQDLIFADAQAYLVNLELVAIELGYAKCVKEEL